MKSFLTKHHRIVFYVSWLVLCLVQARFTDLQDDEAYYWVYSKFLSWGYFDHPPMIALLIKMGNTILPGKLGVRLFIVILSLVTLIITHKLVEKKNDFLFYAICLSLAILQIGAVMAVPDVPLLFFTAFFFLVYRRFTSKATTLNSVLLGLAMAGLLYSKYQGILVIFFTLLSNPAVLKRHATYLSGIVTLVLFLPHVLWEFNHHWITIQYHFFQRNEEHYNINVSLEYILGQCLFMGPVASFIFFTGTFFSKPENSFERALKYTAAGIFLFFLVSTLKGRVEANWTSPAVIPMIILSHKYLNQHSGLRSWLYRLLPATLIAVSFFRVIMVADILPVPELVERFHAWDSWPGRLKAKTAGIPVVFKNSYQRASQYWFHTGQMSYSLNDYKERMNNYNLWPIEDSLLGKTVYVMDIYNLDKFKDSMQARLWKIGFSLDSNFHSFAGIFIQCEPNYYEIDRYNKFTMDIKAIVPEYYKNYLQRQPFDPPIIISFFKGKKFIKDVNCGCSLKEFLHRSLVPITIYPSLTSGKYYFLIAIGSSTGQFTANSERGEISIK